MSKGGVFLKKLIKNKFVLLAVCVIIVSITYFYVQKAIDNYDFETNRDIVSEDGEVDIGTEENSSKDNKVKSGGKFTEEEVDLVIEETEISKNTDNSSDTELGKEGTEKNEIEKEKNGNSKDNSAEKDIEKNKIYIYITGEVNIPGVLILDEGSRIADAINAAGGTTARANIDKVNLVYVLEDGMKVNIPNNNDLKNNSDFEYITMSSGDGGKEDYYGGNSSSDSSSDEGSGNESYTSVISGSSKKYSIVNINTATQTELETLPGIGPSLALKIINYRKENGKFSSIDEIKNVSGIGESKFENLKSYITV